MMDWKELLGRKRLIGPAEISTEPDESSVFFKDDVQRVINSTAFRRLQGKTQVYPLPIIDNVRTRLTHSYEVANVGRMIAGQIHERLLGSKLNDVLRMDMEDIVAAACLCHDLGNPPFGHMGEYAIQHWFLNSQSKAVSSLRKGSKSRTKEVLERDACRHNDFEYFDGNASGFRIATRLSGWRENGGMRLSLPTLAVFAKYPYSSLHANSGKPKFGFFFDDSETANRVFEAVGLLRKNNRFCRHPLAFIVEAADDISYLTADIQDAARIGAVTENDALGRLEALADKAKYAPMLGDVGPKLSDQIPYMRAAAVSTLADEVVDQFVNHYDAIMNGEFVGDLLTVSKKDEACQRIRKLCRDDVYKESGKIRLEAAGFQIIIYFLNLFSELVDHMYESHVEIKDLKRREENIAALLPDEYRRKLQSANPYVSLLVIVDYVSGLTDRYALDLYQRISGNSVTIGRMH